MKNSQADKRKETIIATLLFIIVVTALPILVITSPPEVEIINSTPDVSTGTPEPTHISTEAPLPTATPDGFFLIGHKLLVSQYDIELLARLGYLECNFENLPTRTNCILSVVHTVVLRTTQHYSSDGESIASTLRWGMNIENRQQQFPNSLFSCSDSAQRCPDNIDLSFEREVVTSYFQGARGNFKGFHYGSVPEWPYIYQLDKEGQSIGWFSHWFTDYPTPDYCLNGQGLTIPRDFSLDWPVESRQIIGWHQKYGHDDGIDFSAQSLDAVVTAYPGIVIYGGSPETRETERVLVHYGKYYGNFVVLAHFTHAAGPVLTTWYSHLAYPSYDLREGSTVRQGDPLGVVGSTGHSVGPHLHFEVRVMPSGPEDVTSLPSEDILEWLQSGVPLNPLAYLCKERE